MVGDDKYVPFQTEEYISVVEQEGAEAIEIPTEEDGQLLLENILAQFPNASGLKYRTEANTLRAVRLMNGKLQPPDGEWEGRVYICSFRKEPVVEDKKRKAVDDCSPVSAENNSTASGGGGDLSSCKVARTEIKCSDIIVLGLSFQNTEEQLRDYFSQFGDLELVQMKKDFKGKSRGYAFIRFTDISAQLKVLSERHTIDDRVCICKIPNSKQTRASVPGKVFVGRITEEMEASVLREYFEQYGEVQDIFIPRPFRSFAFVTFKDNGVAQSICGSEHVIKDVKVRVNYASPRIDYVSSRYQGMRGSGRSSGGGGGGDGGGYSSYSSRDIGGGGGMHGGGYGGAWDSGSGGGHNMSHGLGGGMNGGGAGGGNLGQLNPIAVAAALNQAGLGSLLNQSYQSIGAAAPPIPPPNVNQAPPSYGGGGGWGGGGSSSDGRMRQPPPSSHGGGGYHKSGGWA